jgi:hypothetical protein
MCDFLHGWLAPSRPLSAQDTLSPRKPEFQLQARPCGICGGQSVIRTGSSPSTSVFPGQYHYTNSPCSFIDYRRYIISAVDNVVRQETLVQLARRTRHAEIPGLIRTHQAGVEPVTSLNCPAAAGFGAGLC